MPETYGKRQREGVKAKKAAARQDRRIARNERREARAVGHVDPFSWLGESPSSGPDSTD